ncbi:CDP-glycerol glycerophosphotransferase family protein [Paenibacillus sp. PAMC 26794]|uniref:CDP-glycerol glycerophosphotransferase family protein n=1 Tax=Paenibacillus sp. PAMC 26794 TaxID=1257080 RepID=UPI00030AF5E7|nr:CDP-glycerol glycerophosphotransferase family protein [Paenibacillus sp. PAMC 26794]
MKKYRPKVLLLANEPVECNSIALFVKAPTYIKEKFELILKQKNEVSNIDMEDFDIIINSNGVILPSKYQINVEFGTFPISPSKRMDTNLSPSDEYTKFEDLYIEWKNVDVILSSSHVSSVIFNACNGAVAEQYQITGMPINDFLFDDVINKEKLIEIFEICHVTDFKLAMYTFDSTKFEKIIDIKKNELNNFFKRLFKFDEFEIAIFSKFLKANNLFFIIDMTKNEVCIDKETKEILNKNNILLLEQSQLLKQEIYFGQLLKTLDILITDLTPMYLNYFLLNKPVLFNDNQNFQLEGSPIYPYHFWTPGYRFKLYGDLESELLKILDNKDLFHAGRKKVVDILHHYKTAGASVRAWDKINQIWEQGNSQYEKLELTKEQNDLKIAITDNIKILLEQDSLENAKNSIEAFRDHFGIDEEYITMQSFLQFKLGNYKKALHILKEGRLRYPNSYDILFNLGYISQELGRQEMSDYYFEKAQQKQIDN